MFLLRATPEQISKYWELFKWAIENSFPPTDFPTPKKMVNVLKQLLSGRMQLWIAHRGKKWPPESLGIVTTMMIVDDATGGKTLRIQNMFGWQVVQMEEWEDGFNLLAKYAISEGCTGIGFFTANDSVRKLAQRMGFYTEYVYGMIDLTSLHNETKLES